MLHGKYGMMNKMKNQMEFFKNKSVFITGHTGFKGSWLSKILEMAGAKVTGFALPATNPSLFSLAKIEKDMESSIIGDIRNQEELEKAFQMAKPEIVFHMAAQPIVRESYQNPAYTYEVNIMGTVNILECIRKSDTVKSFLNITTDKVYKNLEWEWGYRETDELDGLDPYSNSKSCSELVTHSYQKSFFSDGGVAISTARAGNVIGGGDFAKDRIIPDCIRAAVAKKDIIIRNPYSTRPFQHVLEPLFAYLLIAKEQYENIEKQGYYNVGPKEEDCITTGELATIFCKKWGQDLKWVNIAEKNAPKEANFLKLDCSKIKKELGWQPTWNIEQAIEKTVQFAKIQNQNGDINRCMKEQIEEYCYEKEEQAINNRKSKI